MGLGPYFNCSPPATTMAPSPRKPGTGKTWLDKAFQLEDVMHQVQGSGFRFQGSGLGFGVWGLEFGVWGLGCNNWCVCKSMCMNA